MGIYCHCTHFWSAKSSFPIGTLPPHSMPSLETVCWALSTGNDGSEQDKLDDGTYNSVLAVLPPPVMRTPAILKKKQSSPKEQAAS